MPKVRVVHVTEEPLQSAYGGPYESNLFPYQHSPVESDDWLHAPDATNEYSTERETEWSVNPGARAVVACAGGSRNACGG